MNDLDRYNRMNVANRLRRLADAALVAAEVFSDEDAVPDEPDALAVVRGRMSSVSHSQQILEAGRAGARKAQIGRVA